MVLDAKETGWLKVNGNTLWLLKKSKHLYRAFTVLLLILLFHMKEQPDRVLKKMSIEISNYLNFLLDPHEGNAIEKDTDKIVIIDTEHFPTMMGIKTKMQARNYINWLMQLSGQYIKAKFGRNKEERTQCYQFYDSSFSINSSFLEND